MESVYENPQHPSSYGGINQLHKAFKTKTKSDVYKFLAKNDTYRKFKNSKRKYKRARIVVNSIGHIYQSDLFDVQKLSSSNNGYRYLLVVVDCFSRMIYVKPLKRKTAELTAIALNEVFDHLNKTGILSPRSMMGSDLGTELWNTEADKVYDKYNISHFALRAPKKASLAEISGRYLLDRIYKHLHATDKKRWIDDLQKFVDAKNNRHNRTLGGLAPSQVTFENQSKLIDIIYPNKYERVRSKKPPLTIGQKVQLAMDALPFAKSFHGYFSDKIYEIKQRHDHNGIYRYTLTDTEDGEEVSGTYHREELLEFL